MMNHLLLLQMRITDIKWFKDDDILGAILLAVVIGIIVLILVALNIKKVGIGDTGIRLGKPAEDGAKGARKFNPVVFHQVAHAYGLNKEQTNLLESVFKAEGVSNPAMVMGTPAVLDKHFKNTYRRFERESSNEAETQSRIALLFSIRNAADYAHNLAAAGGIPPIKENMAAALVLGEESYPVKIIEANGAKITTSCPQSDRGPVKLAGGAPVSLSISASPSKHFLVDGQVTEVSSANGSQTVKISLAAPKKKKSQRKFRRRQVGIPCSYRPVRIEGGGKGKKTAIRAAGQPGSGTVVNISAGGCCIKTNGNINAGTSIKADIQMTPAAAVLGQVIRINQSGSVTIMHVKFIKVPRKAMNAIGAMVFEYTD
ncbi:MAG: PilZ domain-containing protein [Treponema sp.]|jgi:hypothetical protein|nr:PilZ domain-containing protein [Treponema sp.]